MKIQSIERCITLGIQYIFPSVHCTLGGADGCRHYYITQKYLQSVKSNTTQL